NRAVVADTLIQNREFDLIANQFQNGIKHRASMNYPIQLFNQILTLNNSVNYEMRMNFQSIEKSYDTVLNDQVVDTLRELGISQNISGNLDLSTNLYAYYSFLGAPNTKMRHVMTPRIGFRYQPNLSSFVTANAGPNGEEITYSPFERSLYREPVGREVGQMSFSLANTFELKTPNRTDSLEDFKKIRIVDAFNISGNYDFFKDSMKLSDISLQLRVSPLPAVSFVTSASFSPYAWDPVTGRAFDEFSITNNQGLGRYTTVNFSSTYTFASQESKKKIEENQEAVNQVWGADFQYYAMNPHEIIDFDIPWKINLTHTWFLNQNTNTETFESERYRTNQNIVINGDVSFTQRWKLGVNSSYDLTENQITQTRLSLNRDMHCWQLAFYWTPVGGQQSFLVRFNATSALFQSAKLELRKPPEFL
ncbi:MAG: putative LPS assembly protein LptD, partial [Brumimicrobium sp.]|nr:putative LPS assembly protein LptD [Brumimicrobium sp.]